MKRQMKLVIAILFCTIVFILAAPGEAAAQRSKTLILVRHAEKAATNDADPELTPQGRERAERLMKIIRKYRPGAVYSTDFKRTRDTVTPIAKRRHLTVQLYDPKKPNDLIDEIMKSKTKRFVIAGHSNSTPALAGLLIKKDLFKSFDESDYGNILIIRIKNGRVQKTEILGY
jgi:2,3-bisphosphoglycerate-dependent phosphoglycerate mutase